MLARHQFLPASRPTHQHASTHQHLHQHAQMHRHQHADACICNSTHQHQHLHATSHQPPTTTSLVRPSCGVLLRGIWCVVFVPSPSEVADALRDCVNKCMRTVPAESPAEGSAGTICQLWHISSRDCCHHLCQSNAMSSEQKVITSIRSDSMSANHWHISTCEQRHHLCVGPSPGGTPVHERNVIIYIRNSQHSCQPMLISAREQTSSFTGGPAETSAGTSC